MKHLRNIYLFLVSMIAGCNATMGQVQPDSVLLSGMTALPNGPQWFYKYVNGTPIYNIFNPKTGKYSLLYPAQYINNNVLFKSGGYTGININTAGNDKNGIMWRANTDFAKMYFRSPADSSSQLVISIGDGDPTDGIITSGGVKEGFVVRKAIYKANVAEDSFGYDMLTVTPGELTYNATGTGKKDIIHSGKIGSGLQYTGGVLSVIPSAVFFTAAPATKTSPGTAGTMAYNNGYLYICVSTNHWERVPWDPTNW